METDVYAGRTLSVDQAASPGPQNIGVTTHPGPSDMQDRSDDKPLGISDKPVDHS